MLRKRLLCFAFMLLAHPSADAQDQQLTINLFVNYGAAYRDGAWAPVDVLVDNKLKDVDGYVQVTAYDANGDALSPIYRVAADSPRQSKKRFRLTCKLQNANRIEAQLFDNGRPVGGPPSYVTVTPIRDEDFLCLVLDDKPDAYGFLSTALYGGKDIRFHREFLDTGRLGFLADNLACYTPFDLIIMGEIDPSRIGVEHREVLTNYVRQGGTLVVWTGANSSRYRGSWLGELMGVNLGEDAIYNGEALAEAVFPPELRGGTLTERQTNATRLIPASDTVKLAGDPFAIAALHPVGQGHVATIAVDAISEILQDNPGFHEVLRSLAALGREHEPLNYTLAGQTAVSQLPSVAGVELSPLSSVITYLLLYFFIAIVGNWLFWNWRKRREMAWVCLVFFSFGFTGYAMFFGTQGRARETELEQFEVYRVPPSSSIAKHTVFAGLLAKGSGRFSGTVSRPDALLADLGSETAPWMPQAGTGFGNNARRPFVFAKSDDAVRLEDFRIGASEMRVIQVDSHVELEGKIKGELIWDEDRIRGTFTNNTGLPLLSPKLFLEGQFFPLRAQGNQLLLDLSSSAMKGVSNPQPLDVSAIYYGNYGQQTTLAQFQQSFFQALFGSTQQTFDGQNFTNPLIGPSIVGWSNAPLLGTFDMDTQANENLKGVLVVADVPIQRSAPPPGTDVDLTIQLTGTGTFHWLTSGTAQGNWNQGRVNIHPTNGAQASIQTPVWGDAEDTTTILIEVIYPRDVAQRLEEHKVALLVPAGGPDTQTRTPIKTDTRRIQGMEFTRDTYRIPDWQDALGRNRQLLSAEVRLIELDAPAQQPSGFSRQRRGTAIEVTLTARAERVAGATAEGAIELWR